MLLGTVCTVSSWSLALVLLQSLEAWALRLVCDSALAQLFSADGAKKSLGVLASAVHSKVSKLTGYLSS